MPRMGFAVKMMGDSIRVSAGQCAHVNALLLNYTREDLSAAALALLIEYLDWFSDVRNRAEEIAAAAVALRLRWLRFSWLS